MIKTLGKRSFKGWDLIQKKMPEGTSLKNEVLAGLTVALALIPESVAFAFVAGVSPILSLQTAVMIGLVYILLPFMILPLYSAIEKLDHTYIEAARDLGANKLQTLIKVILPLTMPGIIGGCLLVLLPALGMFYISDLLGGAKNLLIGNVIKSQVLNARDWPFGAATSIALTLAMAVMLYAYYRAGKLLNKKSELS